MKCVFVFREVMKRDMHEYTREAIPFISTTIALILLMSPGQTAD